MKSNTFFTISALILVLTGIMSGHVTAKAQPVPISGSDIAHNVVYEKKLGQYISFLSDSLCAGRETGTTGNSEAAFWISRQFRKNELMPIGGSYSKHFYPGNGKVGHNIIGFFPGSLKTHCKEYIIVAAHYDGLGILNGKFFPAADSDASGVAAMLGVSEMFNTMARFGKRYGKSILFVALDAKYKNLRGSEALWDILDDESLTDPLSGEPITRNNVCLMVNIDQIGGVTSTLKSGRKDYLIVLGKESLEKRQSDIVADANEKFGIGMEVTYSYYGSKDFTTLFYSRISDQRIFVRNRKSALLFTSGITMNNNKETDTPHTIDLTVLKKRVWLIFHALEEYCSLI